MDTTLILLTKTFPFGHQETYLFNELPYLVERFKKVIIVPYDEFSYTPSENRLSDTSVSVFNINYEAAKHNLSGKEKLKREITIWKIFLFEIFKGREPINHIRFYKRNLSQLRHSFASAMCLKEYIEDTNSNNMIFYNYWLHGGIMISNMCANLMNSKNTRIISRAHAYDVYHKDWYSIYPNSPYLFLAFESWKVRHTHKIATISKHGYDHFLKLYPQLRSKFSIARLGVLDNCTSKIVENEKELVWMTCSNIDENKRVYRIPELISKMNVCVKWFHFGKENSAEDKRKLEQEVSKYKMADKCKIMGLKPNSEIIQFYKSNAVDLFLNLSQIEGIPVSLMEAASFGVPMVATNTVGNPEIVNNENGFLIDVDFGTNELAERLNEFFGNNELIAKKRRASRETFLDHYSAEKNYPEFIKTILLN